MNGSIYLIVPEASSVFFFSLSLYNKIWNCGCGSYAQSHVQSFSSYLFDEILLTLMLTPEILTLELRINQIQARNEVASSFVPSNVSSV